MARNLGTETAVHGVSWAHVHGGYFADSAVARPLVEAARHIWASEKPDVIVDLGGGTGFLLSQLQAEGRGQGTARVNLDCSPAQLEVAAARGISSVCGTVDGFCRKDVVPAGGRVLFLMRSMLHYAGELGLDPLLRHLRAQAEAGEFWVHQTACFERQPDAACLNALYGKMRTGKWYPTVADLRHRLSSAGWQVDDVRPAPTLTLASNELGLRYGLNAAELVRIGREMAAEFPATSEVFRPMGDGFCAELHYRIFVCRAAS